MDCFSTNWIVQIVKSFCLICKEHKSTSKQLAFETILVHWFLWASNPLDRDLLLTSVRAGWNLKGSLLDWKSWDECLVYKWFTLSWSKSLKFLSDNSLLLNRSIEVRSRLCWEIKCPRLAEVLQLSANAKDVCVCSNQCSHFESQSFVDGCMSTDMAWGNILAPASRWSSITFILWPIHLHWGADSAYSPGKKQDVMQNGCVCNTCYLYLPSLSQNVEQGLWLRFCTTASRSQRLLYWWADL